MYRLQNAAVAVSAFSAFLTSFLTIGSPVYWITVLATILIGAVSSVGCQGSSLSVEREWTKALCQEDSTSLAAVNAGVLTKIHTRLAHDALSGPGIKPCQDTAHIIAQSWQISYPFMQVTVRVKISSINTKMELLAGCSAMKSDPANAAKWCCDKRLSTCMV